MRKKKEHDLGAVSATAVDTECAIVPTPQLPHVAHTPGPWTVEDDDHLGQAIVEGPHYSVCVCHHHCVGSIEDEMRVNAQLIAAAPDLLAALQLIVEHYGDPLKVARAAIAKAEGK